MMQIQADMIQASVNRPKTIETTALGAAYLAGLAVGVWKDRDDIEQNREVDRIFTPEMDKPTRDKYYEGGSVRLAAPVIGRSIKRGRSGEIAFPFTIYFPF